MKKLIALFLAAVLSMALFTACGEPEIKTFTVDGKFSVTLDSSFEEETVEGLTAVFLSNKYGMTVLKETFETLDGLGYNGATLSINDYLQLVMKANSLEKDLVEENGFTTFTVESTVDNVVYSYYGLAFKGEDSFWLVQFYCEKDNFEESKPLFIEWAKTITVK